MFHRLAICSTLLAYSVIALFGQGLHEWIEHDDDDDAPSVAVVTYCPPSSSPQISAAPPAGCEHDCDHCAICQHQAQGQFFVAAPPLEVLLAVCELLSSPAPEAVVCPPRFSPAQPRAPPVTFA